MIIIRREHNEVDKDVSYEIYINDNLMGSIKNNDKLSFNLRGLDSNTIYLKGPKRVSEIIKFTLDSNQVIEFGCICNKKKNVFLDLFRVLKGEKTIKLKIDKDFIL